ncbi:MAG: 5-formyltetrahydrofolate cyclo-ligase [Flavobacteriaceae bacterium]|nr:5-formyltetrahydrofolate cyclo-ligase [Flavobacteriaceae bacterium]
MNNNKKFYRTKFQALRMKLLKNDMDSLSDKIFSLVKNLPISKKETFHLFISSEEKREVETKKILYYLYSLNKIVATSKILPDKDLVHVLINKKTRFVENRFKILEPDSRQEILPAEIDVVFIPLLCFDKKGNRVGYGGGYYDKFLKKTSRSCLKIGLSFFEPVDFIQGISKTDITLDMCVTPEKLYNFRTD